MSAPELELEVSALELEVELGAPEQMAGGYAFCACGGVVEKRGRIWVCKACGNRFGTKPGETPRAPADPPQAHTKNKSRSKRDKHQKRRPGAPEKKDRRNLQRESEGKFESALSEAADELEVERMSATTHAIGQAWSGLPPETKEWIKVQLRLALADALRGRPRDTVRRIIEMLLPRLLPRAIAITSRATTRQQAQAALWQLARSKRIPQIVEQRKGMSRGQVGQYHRRQQARGFVPGRNRAVAGRRSRESEFLAQLHTAAAELQEGGESFYTRVQLIPHLPRHEEGHEVLTRHAAAGLVTGADLDALLAGVITPDRGGVSYWKFPAAALHAFSPAAQPAHSLRATSRTSQAAALAAVRSYLTTLYGNALRAPTRGAAMLWIGHALHLIQDSYSGAHVSRTLRSPSGPNPIQKIRAFYVQAWPPARSTAPDEHNVPSDDRDSIWTGPGSLRAEARFAVGASRDFLAMMLRHLGSPGAPANPAEFSGFLARHLSF